jgi:hypothetical protein
VTTAWTPESPEGWYPSPGLPDRPRTAGTVKRWWTGSAWGPDVAPVGTHPDPPPSGRRHLPHGPTTAPVTLPATTVMHYCP